MITVTEAGRIILNNAKLLPCETVSLGQAHGRVLREDVHSDRPQPPFDKALMDGVAIRAIAASTSLSMASMVSLPNHNRPYILEGVVAAGQPQRQRKKPDGCFQIMTGAVVPQGCDTIIPIEQVSIQNGKVYLKEKATITRGQFIRPKGSDAHKGQLLLAKNIWLNTPSIGVLAGVGKAKVKVSIQPKVAVISTGDELVDIDRHPQDYQTRLSNNFALKSLLEASGLAAPSIFHYPDNKKILLKRIAGHLKAFDILILSGGVSMGEFDYVPQVLKELGVKMLFHKVAQKPGKPLWFGKTRDGKVVFALPGNPASTQICAYRYVIPFLKKSAGVNVETRHGSTTLTTSCLVSTKWLPLATDLTLFLPVRVSEKNGTRYAQIVPTGGSGDFAALAQADGFIEYDQTKKSLRPYFSWRI